MRYNSRAPANRRRRVAAHDLRFTDARDRERVVDEVGAVGLATEARPRAYTAGVLGVRGAFLLAEAGLLAERVATTHWALAGPFAARFPEVALATDRLLVDDVG